MTDYQYEGDTQFHPLWSKQNPFIWTAWAPYNTSTIIAAWFIKFNLMLLLKALQTNSINQC